MKLNVFCGDSYLEGYVNIDFAVTRSDGQPIKVDLLRDVLKEGLPYEDGSVEEIIFHEAGEHLNRFQLVHVLKEFSRVMSPGGVLDMTVPPALQQMKMLILSMQASKNPTWEDFEQAHERFSCFKRMDDLAGATHLHSKGDSHLSFWSPEMLRMVVEHCGFKVISIDENIFMKAVKI